MPSRIEDYAIIGDCETAALVGSHGSIDWLCWPRFDSAACFAALLGTTDNGRWLIAPADPSAHASRQYRDGTLVLETDFETADGKATLIDFMPPRQGSPTLIRLVVGRRGRVELQTELVVRFDYGASVPWVSRLADGGLSAVAGPEMLILDTPVALRGEDLRTVGTFSVEAGETIPFVLIHGPSHLPRSAAPEAADAALARTEAFWRTWSDRCPSVGPWTDAVRRSLITLKALSYQPTGGIVAAATTSLPEQIGGPRNWDYRYCWVRDATLTLLAFMKLGYHEEARAWRDWLLRAIAGSPAQAQIMYGIAGERRLPEWEVPWLPGYEGSRPVRVGNAAAAQFQLDVYGEVADALFQARRDMPVLERHNAIRVATLAYVEAAWRDPDEGIWEVRGGRRHFTHSKVMAWVAFDRASTIARETGNDADAARWRRIADEIHAEVCSKAFNAGIGSFVQSYGSHQLDASLLQMPIVGFLPATDPRVRGTVSAIERRLLHDGLVVRYDTEAGVDGLPAGEGAFLACSFWLADNYVLQGRREDACALFERLLALCNDVGLLAEEYDPRAKRMLGNFPQAFSHVGLISTALNLNRVEEWASLPGA
jgi:GH15 family glucan-1,4-alpha-glucosidase